MTLQNEDIELLNYQENLDLIFRPKTTNYIKNFFKIDQYASEIEYAPFVHYTSAEAAIKIIEKKEIWMRSAICMSDYREVQHGQDILLRYFNNTVYKDAFLKTFDSIFPDVGLKALQIFFSNFPNVLLDTYITSISEHLQDENPNGRLSMWRAFGNSPTRVAIVFNGLNPERHEGMP